MADNRESPLPPHPNVTERAEAARLARVQREAAALRANLARRKAQARARDATDEKTSLPTTSPFPTGADQD